MNALAAALLFALAAAAPDAPAKPPAPPAPPAAAVIPAIPAPPAAPAEATAPDASVAKRSRLLKGSWPSASPRVSLELDHVKTREALKRLASQATWSMKFRDTPHGRVDAVFTNVPADEVLASLLKESGMVAEREGDVITISEIREGEDDDEAKTEESEAGEAAQTLTNSGERQSVGGSVTVKEGETVKEAVAVGGNVLVDGIVQHDAVAVGGNVKLGPKAEVGHDVVSVGGSLDIDPSAKVGGSRVSVGLGGLTGFPFFKGSHHEEKTEEPTGVHGFFWNLASTLARYAVFFVLGLLLLAFMPERVRAISRELRRAPGPSWALGMLGLVGFALLTLLSAVLVLALVGIPLLLILGLVGSAAVLLGFTSLALEVGGLVPSPHAKRTQVVVLFLGTAILFLVFQLPYLGSVALFFVAIPAAFGAILRTKFGNNRVDANFVPEP